MSSSLQFFSQKTHCHRRSGKNKIVVGYNSCTLYFQRNILNSYCYYRLAIYHTRKSSHNTCFSELFVIQILIDTERIYFLYHVCITTMVSCHQFVPVYRCTVILCTGVQSCVQVWPLSSGDSCSLCVCVAGNTQCVGGVLYTCDIAEC